MPSAQHASPPASLPSSCPANSADPAPAPRRNCEPQSRREPPASRRCGTPCRRPPLRPPHRPAAPPRPAQPPSSASPAASPNRPPTSCTVTERMAPVSRSIPCSALWASPRRRAPERHELQVAAAALGDVAHAGAAQEVAGWTHGLPPVGRLQHGRAAWHSSSKAPPRQLVASDAASSPAARAPGGSSSPRRPGTTRCPRRCKRTVAVSAFGVHGRVLPSTDIGWRGPPRGGGYRHRLRPGDVLRGQCTFGQRWCIITAHGRQLGESPRTCVQRLG